ncbi:hypothetical protein [Promicromonospora sp. NPDC060271]|uniref:hypothetical protein n=1 Tax=Promicromonospora sp. NPDC060271 TaxID=3347089 RepID=UPI003650E632
MQFEGPAELIGWAARWAEVLGAVGAVLIFLIALYIAIRESWRARKESARERDRLREEHDVATERPGK